MRIVVWEDESGKVQIGYWPPSRITEAHGVENVSEVTDKMATALGAIADAAAAP